jgi:hypothetical protein
LKQQTILHNISRVFLHKIDILSGVEGRVAEGTRRDTVRTLLAQDVSTRHQQRFDLFVKTDATAGCPSDELMYATQGLSTRAELIPFVLRIYELRFPLRGVRHIVVEFGF